MIIRIAAEFSDRPAGRSRRDGAYSGERFREEWLWPALQRHETVTVDLDGVPGYEMRFLDEAFAGLVRSGRVAPEELRRRLVLRWSDPAMRLYANAAWRFVREAEGVPLAPVSR